MKKLKILAVIISIILISIIAFVISQSSSNSTNKEKNDKHDVEVINNNSRIVKYDGYIYYVSSTNSPRYGISNTLCRMKIDDNTVETIYLANQSRIDDRLIIFKNKLFFNILGQTYYVDIDNIKSISKFNQGNLY